MGCDADITLFNAEDIADMATYGNPGKPSKGIPHVIVNGVMAVENGELTGNLAGRILRRSWEIPGVLPHLGSPAKHGIEALSG